MEDLRLYMYKCEGYMLETEPSVMDPHFQNILMAFHIIGVKSWQASKIMTSFNNAANKQRDIHWVCVGFRKVRTTICEVGYSIGTLRNLSQL